MTGLTPVAAAHEVAERLRAAGFAEPAAALQRRLVPGPDDPVTLVVLGEAKRGKSSLINALLRRPGLLPVDPDTATNTAIVVRRGAAAVIRVFHEQAPEGEEHPLEALPLWAAEGGNPGNERAVAWVEVDVPDEALDPGLVLVDTPGTGGLNSAHAQVAMASLGRADAVLFVTEAEAPLNRSELEFLARAGESVGTVLVALTKIDAEPGWRDVWHEDCALLARHAPGVGVAPPLPISCRLQSLALDLAGRSPSASRELLRESGIEALRTAITREVVRPAGRLRVRNAVELARAALPRLEALHAVALAEPGGADDLRAELQRRQEVLNGLTRANSAWPTDLADGMQELRLTMNEYVTRAAGDLQRRYDRGISDGTIPSAHLADRLRGDLASLAVGTLGQLEMQVDAMLRRLDEALLLTPLGITPTATAPGSGAAPELELTQGRAVAGSALPPAIAYLGPIALPVSLTSSLGAFIGLSFVTVFPLGLLAGGVLSAVAARNRRVTHQRQEARATAQASIAEAANVVKNDLARRFVRLQGAVRDELRTGFEQGATETRAAIAEQQRLLQHDAAAQSAARAAAESELSRLGELRRALDRHID